MISPASACARLLNSRPARSALSIGLVALLACQHTLAEAEGISINGGATWDGWTLRGVSNLGSTQGTSGTPGIYATGGTTGNQYRVYSTSFLFDSTTHFKTGTTTGSQTASGSTGFGGGTYTITTGTVTNTYSSFANGNTVLGLGVQLLSGTLVQDGNNVNTARFDLQGGSYMAAPTFGGAGGKASFSTYSHMSDFTVQFNLSAADGRPAFSVSSINSQGGDPFAVPGSNSTLTLSQPLFRNSDILPFRAFGSGTADFTSYQMFFDLTAAYQLFGPTFAGPSTWGAVSLSSGTAATPYTWQPIGQAGADVDFSLNGYSGSNNTAFGAAVVPEPSLQALTAVSLAALAAGQWIVRRKRRVAGRPDSSSGICS